jgi:CheY-like chemotaxis protein
MAKILLVDDSKTLLKTISRMLTRGGHEVVAQNSGHAAVAYLKANAVDIVLTDLYMPGTDGFEIVQHVRGMAQPPPLIVMSSNLQAYGVFRDAQALGASAALHKPFTSQQVLESIDAVLRGIVNAERRHDGPVPFEVAI